MEDVLEKLRKTHWINIYISDSSNSPVCNIVFVDKQDKNKKSKYPIWRDKEKPTQGYVGKLDTYQGNSQGNLDSSTSANNAPTDDESQECPF